MLVTVIMSMQDVYRMLRHLHFGQHKVLNTLFFGLSAICVMGSIYILFSPEIPLKSFYLLSVVPVLYLIVIPLSLIFQANRILKKQEVFRKPLKYRFLEKGIEMANVKAKSLIEWSTLKRVDETTQDFIFILNRASAFSVPKAKLGDKEEELRRIISSNLPKEKFTLK